MKSDIEIARAANTAPISEIAENIGLPASAIIPYGNNKAKIKANWLANAGDRRDGALILVTAMNPTPAGEGKTTTTVGLGDALNRIGKKAMICLREPSLGPCFGIKGGAAGGGYAQVAPMEEINLHFTGDFHAITSAHNLLAAMIDNHVHWSNELEIDTRRIAWRRVVDMNDRALRQVTVGLGGPANGFAHEGGFDITVASEVMAIFCLATDLEDMSKRLGDIVVAWRRDLSPVTARDLKADGAMTALLRDALQPNLVQTLEGGPAFIHGGPFANIAHGCNSVIATKTALKLADYVVTEAGFGADLGAEKFFDIKCRKADLSPKAAVIVATIRSLKMNGGVAKANLKEPDVEALKAGLANLERHVENVRRFGVPPLIAINHFEGDADSEINAIEEFADRLGVQAFVCRHWAEGGAGAVDLARAVVNLIDSASDDFSLLYPDDMPLAEKIRTIAQKIYHAEDVNIDPAAMKQLGQFEDLGFGAFPVCMAKTPYSFTADPSALGAPSGHILPVREVRLAAGAGFVVALCGEVMTMPGLPRRPGAETITVNANGEIEGLF